MSLQESYDYVIVGGGVAAASAVKGIRSQDPSGTVAVIGSELNEPVYRPVLTKDLWLKDDATLEGSSLAGDLVDDEHVPLALSHAAKDCHRMPSRRDDLHPSAVPLQRGRDSGPGE